MCSSIQCLQGVVGVGIGGGQVRSTNVTGRESARHPRDPWDRRDRTHRGSSVGRAQIDQPGRDLELALPLEGLVGPAAWAMEPKDFETGLTESRPVVLVTPQPILHGAGIASFGDHDPDHVAPGSSAFSARNGAVVKVAHSCV